ncbi:Short-chain type dehydrogenase/reductase [Diplonema papillatum]|nr:Short-chain type dehydrogenase/reductase [Diplonema papillatum]
MSFLLSVFRSDKSIIEGEFAGKTILLTGAGRGIGREIALELARCGAKTLLLGSLSELPLQETATQCRQQASHPDFEAFACPCDVSDRGSVQRMKTTFQTQQPSRSTLHYIITNAGLSLRVVHFTDVLVAGCLRW